MTDDAIITLASLERATGRHIPSRTTADEGAEFRSACGRYAGTIAPDGRADVRDRSGGPPGVRVELAFVDGRDVLRTMGGAGHDDSAAPERPRP